jgi:mannose-1-phosphate guanylyltransferase
LLAELSSLPQGAMQVRPNNAAIILAGGDGMRLLPLTRYIAGRPIPKQFCCVTSGRTLLEDTIHRVHQVVPLDRIVVVVNRSHGEFYQPLLSDLASSQTVLQPSNRGTAAAILYGLERLAKIAADASVTIFPADHFVGHDARFMTHVAFALDSIAEFPELAVILGMAPASAETSYGWIEPAAPVSPAKPPVFRVRRFWEKPELELARTLWRQGCLWNSFVIAANPSVLRGMIAEHAPRLSAAFKQASASLASRDEEAAAEALYAKLESVGFSEQILSRCPPNLAVQRVDDVKWSDLGEPNRVLDVLSSSRYRPAWVDSFERERTPERRQ